MVVSSATIKTPIISAMVSSTNLMPEGYSSSVFITVTLAPLTAIVFPELLSEECNGAIAVISVFDPALSKSLIFVDGADVCMLSSMPRGAFSMMSMILFGFILNLLYEKGRLSSAKCICYYKKNIEYICRRD